MNGPKVKWPPHPLGHRVATAELSLEVRRCWVLVGLGANSRVIEPSCRRGREYATTERCAGVLTFRCLAWARDVDYVDDVGTSLMLLMLCGVNFGAGSKACLVCLALQS